VSRRLITPLDRYIATEFTRIFGVTILGFPVLVFVIDLVDNLRKYTERKLPAKAVALSYFYWIPDTLFMVLPAAVLFATVFSIGTFTRYSEITAAKASGISFYRFIAPILVMATLALGLDLAFGEIAPPANAIRLDLLEGTSSSRANDRYNFAFASDRGRIYRIYTLNVRDKAVDNIEIEARGSDKKPGMGVGCRASCQVERCAPGLASRFGRGAYHSRPHARHCVLLRFVDRPRLSRNTGRTAYDGT